MTGDRRPSPAAIARSLRRAALAGFVVAVATTAASRVTAADLPPLQRLSGDDRTTLWQLPAPVEAPSAANGGRTQNLLAFVERGEAVLIDPGPDPALAPAIAAQLERLGARVVAVIDTHPHPENVLGNGGWPATVPLWSTRHGAAVMRQRCQQCRDRFVDALGLASLRGAPIRVPDRLLDEGQPEAAGAASPARPVTGDASAGGRRWWWADVRGAHSDADLVLLDRASATLVTGGLAGCEVLPELQEGKLERWIVALQYLEREAVREGARRMVGAQGGACEAAAGLARSRGYLQALRQAVQEDLQAGGDAATVSRRIALPAFGAMAGYRDRHPLNVQKVFRQLEDESFGLPAK